VVLCLAPKVLSKGLIWLYYYDDDISLFVTTFNIPVCINNLFHWLMPVDDRLDFSSLDKLFQRNQILCMIFAVHPDVQIIPSELSTRLHFDLELFPTASRIKSYRSSPRVKSSLVQSMILATPNDLTKSKFGVLHTPVTSAPKYLAICTANVPTLPDVPLKRTFYPLLIFPIFKRFNAANPLPLRSLREFLQEFHFPWVWVSSHL